MSSSVSCAQVRAALSARLDGEASALPDDLVDTHLQACADCQQWYASAVALGRNLTMGAAQAPETPGVASDDLASLVLDSAAARPSVTVGMLGRSLPLALGRLGLVLLAVGYVVWAMVPLFGSPSSVDATTVRLALASGLAWAAWRPKVASGVLPIYMGLFAFSAGFATRALVMGLLGAEAVGEDSAISLADPITTLGMYGAAAALLVVVWLGRHHVIMPLRQSVRAALAQPMSFSREDVERNSTYRGGDRRRPF